MYDIRSLYVYHYTHTHTHVHVLTHPVFLKLYDLCMSDICIYTRTGIEQHTHNKISEEIINKSNLLVPTSSRKNE